MSNRCQRQWNIMIIDDSPQNLHLLEAMLVEQGYRVFAMPNGSMALNIIEKNPPDLILLDILMPELDGYEVCVRLKANPMLRDIPVIFLSALNEPLDKVRAFNVGGIDYITKPFYVEEVEARVRLHLHLHNLQQQLEVHNAQLEEKIRERTRDLQEANERLAGLDQAKSDFLRIISHELRTPLHGLLGMAQLLFMELPESENVTSYLQLFKQSEDRLITLINDAILFNEVKVVGKQFASQTSCLDDVLTSAVEKAHAFSHQAGVSFPLISPSSDLIIGRKEILVKAIHSLLVLAIKFGKRGSTVNLTINDKPESVELIIVAYGYAIPPNDLPKFFQLLSLGKTITPGGDLGLAPAIADSVIKAFGGNLTVENTGYPGIQFVVRLQKSNPSLSN